MNSAKLKEAIKNWECAAQAKKEAEKQEAMARNTVMDILGDKHDQKNGG